MDNSVIKNLAHALCTKGQEQHLHGDIADAIKCYTASLGLYPTAEAYTFRGWAYSLRGRLDEAIEECKKAIALDPTFGNPYNDIGSYLVHKGKFDEAIAWLEKAKTAPRYEPRHFPYMNLGRIYAKKGMLLLSIREFKMALEIHPGEPTCLSMLRKLQGALK